MPASSRPFSPRWVSLLQDSLNTSTAKDPSQIAYALSSSSASGPRVRMVVHRGFVNERRPNEDPNWSENPAVDSEGRGLVTDGLLLTTDIRSPKADQILEENTVELVWWFTPTQQQFRVRARAFVLPPPGHPAHASFPAEKLSPSGLPKFNWESERLRGFRKLNPPLRASFVRPTPGTPLAGTDIDPSKFPASLPSDLDESATAKEKELIVEALGNMALVVLEAFEVDLCDLAAKPNTRTQWRISPDGEWTEAAVVP